MQFDFILDLLVGILIGFGWATVFWSSHYEKKTKLLKDNITKLLGMIDKLMEVYEQYIKDKREKAKGV